MSAWGVFAIRFESRRYAGRSNLPPSPQPLSRCASCPSPKGRGVYPPNCKQRLGRGFAVQRAMFRHTPNGLPGRGRGRC